MTNIITVDYSEYGLESTQAQNISKAFKPMLDTMEELEKEYNEVVKMPIEDPKTSKIAKELRLKYVKTRTWTAKIHKQEKAFYLAGWKFVDGWKNAQIFSAQWKEEKLSEIENYFENLEKEKIAKIAEERKEKLKDLELENIDTIDLWSMSNEVFESFYFGCQNSYKLKKEAERKAEEERIAKEKAEKEEQERIKKENEELKRKQEEQDKKLKEAEAEKQRLQALEFERIEKENSERKEAELMAKRKEYKEYRETLWYTEENKNEFIEKKEWETMVIYKKVWEFIL